MPQFLLRLQRRLFIPGAHVIGARSEWVTPDSTDLKKFYQKVPYNTYSKRARDICPGIYAVAYDD